MKTEARFRFHILLLFAATVVAYGNANLTYSSPNPIQLQNILTTKISVI